MFVDFLIGTLEVMFLWAHLATFRHVGGPCERSMSAIHLRLWCCCVGGVIWFTFHVLQLRLIRFMQQKLALH